MKTKNLKKITAAFFALSSLLVVYMLMITSFSPSNPKVWIYSGLSLTLAFFAFMIYTQK